MTATVSRLLKEVLQLPEESREELLERIVENTVPPRKFVDQQLSTVRRRMERVSEGRSSLIPAEEAHRLVRESLRTKI